MQINLKMIYLSVENFPKYNILTQKWTFWHRNVDILARECGHFGTREALARKLDKWKVKSKK